MKAWYLTLGVIGGLVGVFGAGLVLALAQGLPGSWSGRLSDAQLTGVAVGMVFSGIALGFGITGVAHGVMWLRGRRAGGADARTYGPADESNWPIA